MAGVIEVSVPPITSNKLYMWESEAGNGFVIIAAQNEDEAWQRLMKANPELFWALQKENGGLDWFTDSYIESNLTDLVKDPVTYAMDKVVRVEVVRPTEYTLEEFPDTWLINRPSA
jgi:hypothetical protein